MCLSTATEKEKDMYLGFFFLPYHQVVGFLIFKLSFTYQHYHLPIIQANLSVGQHFLTKKRIKARLLSCWQAFQKACLVVCNRLMSSNLFLTVKSGLEANRIEPHLGKARWSGNLKERTWDQKPQLGLQAS